MLKTCLLCQSNQYYRGTTAHANDIDAVCLYQKSPFFYPESPRFALLTKETPRSLARGRQATRHRAVDLAEPWQEDPIEKDVTQVIAPHEYRDQLKQGSPLPPRIR